MQLGHIRDENPASPRSTANDALLFEPAQYPDSRFCGSSRTICKFFPGQRQGGAKLSGECKEGNNQSLLHIFTKESHNPVTLPVQTAWKAFAMSSMAMLECFARKVMYGFRPYFEDGDIIESLCRHIVIIAGNRRCIQRITSARQP